MARRHVLATSGVVIDVLDILLPSTDAGVAFQFIAVLAAGTISLVALRSKRDLRLLVVGITVLAIALMTLRAVH
jgi:hypothetical protein